MSTSIEYKFIFIEDELQDLDYNIDTQHEGGKVLRTQQPAAWTLLKTHQCSICPLKNEQYCPAALDIEQIIDDFKGMPAYKKIEVQVLTPERNISKFTGLEEGLRSFMGLIMAHSDCPILSKLKPMAYTHLPFATHDEFIIRSVGTYLIRQYFHYHDGHKPDWELTGLVELNKQLQLVNQAMWQRVYSACEGDSNLKALLSFFSLSSSVSYSLETQLQKLKPEFLQDSDISTYL